MSDNKKSGFSKNNGYLKLAKEQTINFRLVKVDSLSSNFQHLIHSTLLYTISLTVLKSETLQDQTKFVFNGHQSKNEITLSC